MLLAVTLFVVLFAPSFAFAWGPLTHVSLAEQLLSLGPALLPPLVYAAISKFPRDFLYGSIIADIVIGKKFQERRTGAHRSHSWELSRELLRLAETEAAMAFAYGYQGHLAADTVAHHEYIPRYLSMPKLTHAMLEMKADALVRGAVWSPPDPVVQLRNDMLLERALERTRLSFGTNKRLFNGMLRLSRLNLPRRVNDLIDRSLPYPVRAEEIRFYQQRSLEKMVESYTEGRGARVHRKDPLGWRTRQRLAAFAGR